MVLFIGLVAADASVFVDTDYNNNSIYDISNVTSLGYCNATDCYTVSQLLSDNDTTYTAGINLTLVGNEFSLDTISVISWLNNIYVQSSELVGIIGNWSADQINYYTKTDVDTNITDANTSMKNYADGTFITQADEPNLDVNSSTW